MTQQYNLQKFEFVNKRRTNRGISIRGSGAIAFPAKLYDDNNIKNYKYVVLYLDKQQKLLGIHLTSDEEEKSRFSITRSKQAYGGYITVHSFFKVNDIDPKKYAGEYPWKKISFDGKDLFLINLNEKK